MYKCKHCSYTSRRAFDLRRHENRKTPCFAETASDVKCSPPQPPGSSSKAPLNCTINNTTNNTINNSQNVNITFNFGQESLESLGKCALPQHIYFKDLFPMNNTMMQTCDNEWNLREIDDLYNTLMECMKSYMTPYFLHAEKKLEKIYDEDQPKFKRLRKSIREFGHKVLWLDWYSSDIRQIEAELNDPYCENERSRRIQEMKTLLLEHIYDKMKKKLSLQ